MTSESWKDLKMDRRTLLKRAGFLGGGIVAAPFLVDCSNELEWKYFQSSNFPYSVNYPPDWEGGSFSDPIFGKLDMFNKNGVRLSDLGISVDSRPITPNYDLEKDYNSWVVQEKNNYQRLGARPGFYQISTPQEKDPNGLNLAGRQHPGFHFLVQLPNVDINTDIFRTNFNAWYIHLQTARKLTDNNLSVFKKFLDSFKTSEGNRS